MAKYTSAKQAIRVWLAEHDKTQDWLAREIGISNSLLSYVLSGYRPLKPEIADDIQRVTGLNLKPFITKAAVA